MATDNLDVTQQVSGNTTDHVDGAEIIQVAENTPPSGGQGNAAPAANQPVIPGVPNGEVRVTVPAGQTVVRVQVAPGETIDLPFDGALAAKFGQQGNLAIKLGDQTIILLGYAQANQQAGVTVKDDKGQAIDVASVIAQTDPNLDIQTAAGPAAGPTGPQGGHLFFGFAGGSGLGGFGELNVINPTELHYQTISPDETILVRAPESPAPTFSVTGDLLVNEDDLHTGGDVSSEALILSSSSGPSSALIDQLSHSPTFSNTYFTFYSGSQGNDPFDVNDHENGSQTTPPLPDNFVDQNGHPIDQDPEPLSVTAHVTANLNGNVPGTLTFDHNGVTPVIDQLNALGLTSQGHALSYELLPADGAHGESVVAYYTVTYSYGEQQYSYNVIVFSLEVDQVSSSTGEFDVTYTLYGPLDNAPHGAADTGAQGSGAAGEDIFFLDTTFFVSDSAGHTSQSTPGTMVFQTVDDVPSFGHMDYEYMPNGQLESYSYVPVQYEPANLTIGLDESAGQQDTHYTIGNPDTSLGQVSDQNTDDASSLFTHVGSNYNYETGLQATNDVLHDSFASDPLGVLNNIDPSYFNNPGDHSQGFNTYIDSAQTWLDISFGADGRAGEYTDTGVYVGNPQAGQTVFTGDGAANATAFQLYLTSNGQSLDHGGTLTTQVETNLTIGDGLKVIAYQIDADTIIGIAYPAQEGGDGPTTFAAVQGNGIPVFTLHVDPETGALTLTEYHQINNPDGTDANDAVQLLDSLGEQFVYVRGTDFDGDYVDGGLAVSFVDDAPSATITPITESGVTIDESAGLQADDQAGAAPFAYGTALAWGTSSGPVVDTSASSYGTDGPGTTVLSLHPSSAGVDSGLIDTATGQHVYLYQDGDNVVGRVGSGGVADPNGAVAIAVSIDQSGDLTTAEYRALYHDVPTQGDTSEGVSIADGALQATVTVTDSDGDTATSTTDVGSHVSFLDDGPAAAITGTDTNGVSIDESAGQQADDQAGVAPFSYGVALAWGTTGAPVVDTSGTNFGVDGEKSLVLALHPSVDGVDSGLIDTATGQHIYLYQDGDNVVGLVGNGGNPDPNGAVAIAVSIDQSGELTVAEYRALYHDIATNGDTSEGVSINPEALQVTVTATDGDGDTSTASTDVGGYVSFLDDGPTAHISAVADSGVTIDETAGVQAGTDDHSGPAPFPYGVALAWGTNGTAVVDTSATTFGVDGEKSLVLSIQPASAGVDSGLIDTATGQHIYLYQDGDNVVGKVGSGGVADPNGAIAIAVTIDQSGDLTVAEYRALQHPTGTDPDTSEGVSITDGALQVTVTATDGDGDTSTATANIGSHVTFLDDGPTAAISGTDTDGVTIDESAGLQADDHTGAAPFSAAYGTALAWGTNGTAVVSTSGSSYGVDGAGSTTLSLHPTAAGVDSGLIDVATGEHIYLYQGANDGEVIGRVGNGGNPDPNGAIDIAISINQNGTLNVAEYHALQQPNGTNPDTSEGVSINEGALEATVTVIDKDGDSSSASTDVGGYATFLDDGPTVSASAGSGTVTIDETPGVQAGTDDQSGAAPFSYGTALAWGTSSTAVIGTTSSYGVDGPGSMVLSLHPSSAGVDSGLIDVATGQHIFLYLDGSNVVGKVGGSGGAVAIAVSLNGDGTLNVAEYRALQHPNGTDPDNSEGVSITDGALQVTATIIDKDGDSATGTVNIGSHVTFLDDGPTASLSVVAQSGVTIDESAGVQAGTDDQAGKDPFSYGSPLAWGTNGTAVVSTTGTSYGVDGAGSTVLSLHPSSAGVDSGLIDVATGQHIFLYQDGSNVVGNVGGSGGAVAIAVSLNGDGTLNVAEYRALQHGTGSTPDTSEGVSITNGALQVTETVTDKDGDSSTATVDIGSHVTFLDDGPTAALAVVAQSGVTIDETAGVQAGTDDKAGADPFSYGTPLAWGTNGTAVVSTAGASYGVDGAGTTALSLHPSSAGVDSGLIDTATGQHIFLYQDGNNVVGKVGSAAGAIAIAVSLNADGTLNVAEYRALQHQTASNGDTSEGVSITDGALQVTETIADKDGDSSTATVNIGSHIHFLDDGPTATNDNGGSLNTNATVSQNAAGGVLSNDSFGVDGSGGGVVGVAAGDTKAASTGGVGGAGVAGSFGTLTLNADGSYSYTAKNNVDGTDTFTYTIKDGDGDTSTATLTFTVHDQANGTLHNGSVTVAEDSEPGQNTGDLTIVKGHVDLSGIFTPADNETVTSITINNIPTGVIISDGTQTVTGNGSNSITILAANFGSVTLQEPADNKDNDYTLSYSALISDPTSGLTNTLTGGVINVTVDAVADMPTNVSITVADSADAGNSFSNGEIGTLNVKATFGDYQDGSETHTVTVQLETGFTAPGLASSGTLPDGISYTYNSGTGVVVFTVPNGTASINETINIQAPASGTLPGTLTFTATATAAETTLSGGEPDLTNNTSSVVVSTGIPSTRILNGDFITNSNVQHQQLLLSFVDSKSPLDAFAQIYSLDAQGQQGSIVTDAGFNINHADMFYVGMESYVDPKVIITDFSLEGVSIVNSGNAQVEIDDSATKANNATAITAEITPNSGGSVPFSYAQDGTSAGETLSNTTHHTNYLYGASGNDTLNGDTSTATHLDILNGGSGTDTLNGGNGTNLFVYGAGDHINGVAGQSVFDILRIDSGASAITSEQDQGKAVTQQTVNISGQDLHNIDAVLITEEARPDANFGTTVQLKASDVLSFTDSGHSMYIIGSAGDKVDLTSDSKGTWTDTGTQVFSTGGQAFEVWHATVGGVQVTLNVDHDLTVDKL